MTGSTETQKTHRRARMRQDAIAFLPQPKRLDWACGAFAVPPRPTIAAPEADARLAKALARILPRGAPARNTQGADFRLTLVDRLPLPPGVAPERAAEAYALRIGPAGVDLRALSFQGLFYGIQTLGQALAQAPRTLPCLSIVDWPDMGFRGIHYMMGARTRVRYPQLADMILTLARHKMTHFVFEYDDQFPWRKHAVVASPDSLTRAEIARLVRLAEENFVEITPLLDSLGHSSQYIGHKEYKHLAENWDGKGPMNNDTMCPRHPETLPLMKDLWREVLELHPNARYAHVSGDEITLAQGCPRCTPEKGNAGVARLYTEYFTPLTRWIREQGKIPMIWGDMLIKYPEDIAHFPRDVVVCDWCYDGQDKASWDFVPLHTSMDGSMSPERRRLFERYWHRKPGDRTFVPYPYARFFADQGFPVIGASGVNFANNKRFALAVKAAHGLGLLVTLWDFRRPPMASWFGLLAGAEFAWHARGEERAAYSGRYARAFLGLPAGRQDAVANADADAAGDNVDRLGFLSKLWPESRTARRTLACARAGAARPGPHRDARQLFALTAEVNLLHMEAGALLNRIDRRQHGWRGFAPVDLRAVANSAIRDATPAAADPLQVEHGLHRVAGIPFRILGSAGGEGRAAICLKGRRRPQGPEAVRGIPVRRKLDRCYVLLSAYDVAVDAHIADIVMHLEGGGRVSLALKDGQTLSDWRRGLTPLARAAVAWQQPQIEQYAYLCWIDNPRPETPVTSLDIVSTGGSGYPIVLAVTAARGKARPLTPRAAAVLDRELVRIAKAAPRLDAALARLFMPMFPKAWRAHIRESNRETTRLTQWLDIYRQRLASPAGAARATDRDDDKVGAG